MSDINIWTYNLFFLIIQDYSHYYLTVISTFRALVNQNNHYNQCTF